MTERVPPLLQPFIRKFYSYSDNPLSLGISDFCSHDQNGLSHNEEEVEFPYVAVLKPVYGNNIEQNRNVSINVKEQHGDEGDEGNDNDDDGNDESEQRFDDFLDDLLRIPSGSVLFDIYACPDPTSALDPTKIQRIGRIITTSEMITSQPDDGLFFRHQKKEEDFDLRPHWRDEVQNACASKCGNAQGTIGKLIGATFLESNINENEFIDFEIE
jgi:hypothetical protein